MQLTQQPTTIGPMTVTNRLVMPPMATGKSDDQGYLTDDIIRYYDERAAHGRVGLIITEHSFICQQGKASLNQATLADDGCIPGLARLAQTIHAHGVKAIVQMNHAGIAANPAVTGLPAVGPSAVPHPRAKDPSVLPTALTIDEIRAIRDAFAAAALRVQAAGFDGVEIHCAHGYLLNQFYSPLTNRREDEYGPQSIESRTRFAVEVIRAVRAAVRSDFAVAIRLGGCDYRDGGSTIADAVAACRLFEAAGADLLDISGGMCGYIVPGLPEVGYFREMTAAIRAQANVPVLLTGGVTRPEQAEALLADGAADLIGIGRALYKDPRWAED